MYTIRYPNEEIGNSTDRLQLEMPLLCKLTSELFNNTTVAGLEVSSYSHTITETLYKMEAYSTRVLGGKEKHVQHE